MFKEIGFRIKLRSLSYIQCEWIYVYVFTNGTWPYFTLLTFFSSKLHSMCCYLPCMYLFFIWLHIIEYIFQFCSYLDIRFFINRIRKLRNKLRKYNKQAHHRTTAQSFKNQKVRMRSLIKVQSNRIHDDLQMIVNHEFLKSCKKEFKIILLFVIKYMRCLKVCECKFQSEPSIVLLERKQQQYEILDSLSSLSHSLTWCNDCTISNSDVKTRVFIQLKFNFLVCSSL